MKTKMKLVEIDHKDKLKTEAWTYIYKPTLEQLKDYVEFKVKGPITEEVLHSLGLPKTKGDTWVMEMAKKEEQSKLGKK